MEIASRLRAAGVPAEFGFKANPKMGDQLGAAYCGCDTANRQRDQRRHQEPAEAAGAHGGMVASPSCEVHMNVVALALLAVVSVVLVQVKTAHTMSMVQEN